MSTLRILLAEIRYRKLGFALSLAAFAAAAALFVAGPILVDGYRLATHEELAALQARVDDSERSVAAAERSVADAEAAAAVELKRLEDETRKTMRALGFNLLLLHRDEDVVDFLAGGLPKTEMPQAWVAQLAADVRLTFVTHLVATLRGAVAWQGRSVRLVGYLPEAPQAHMSHETPMGYAIEPGTAILGFRLGQDKRPGEQIELAGRPLRVAQVLPEQGSDEDGTIAVHLSDAQAILDKPGKINLILALECRCTENALPRIRRQLAEVLPETQVLRDASKAEARSRQRTMVAERNQQIIARQKESLGQRQKALAERQKALADTAEHRRRVQQTIERLASVVTPLVVLAAAVWVGLLALGNVRERRTEIGVLRALGKPERTIAALFLGKAVLLGALGGALGTLAGLLLARWLGVQVLELPAEAARLHLGVVLGALGGAPLLSALASYLPTLAAVLQDPAVVLRDA
jgi:hypothetical protein